MKRQTHLTKVIYFHDLSMAFFVDKIPVKQFNKMLALGLSLFEHKVGMLVSLQHPSIES